ncbi:unnamed protein product [Sphagnum jensenii]|uniref:Uncharacterized protein n=1 Tax=Sphagnum jensenii TaxID=128206 RepID=A0ABP1BZ03_9BRYO
MSLISSSDTCRAVLHSLSLVRRDCVQKTLKRLEEKDAWKGEPRCASFLGGQIKILAASFIERGVQTFILLELHWF